MLLCTHNITLTLWLVAKRDLFHGQGFMIPKIVTHTSWVNSSQQYEAWIITEGTRKLHVSIVFTFKLSPVIIWLLVGFLKPTFIFLCRIYYQVPVCFRNKWKRKTRRQKHYHHCFIKVLCNVTASASVNYSSAPLMFCRVTYDRTSKSGVKKKNKAKKSHGWQNLTDYREMTDR